MKKIFQKENILNLLLSQAVFAVVILLLEITAKLLTTGISGAGNFWFAAFVPALSLFLAGITNWFSPKVNRIINAVIIGLVTFYYCIQIVYFAMFDSFLSFALLGLGGDAIANFGGNIWDELAIVWYKLVIIFIPFAAYLVLSINKVIKDKKYSVPMHIIALVLSLPVWMLGVLLLKVDGNTRTSAYYAYTNQLSDTDTTAEKLGLLPTTLVEAGMGKLNHGLPKEETPEDNGDDPNKIINIFATDTPTPTATPVPEVTTAPGPTDIITATPTSSPTPTPIQYWTSGIDFKELAKVAPNADIKALCEYFDTVDPTQKNEYTGIFEGYNLVYICAEAFSDYAVNKDFTPTLYKLANNGVVLKNYYNSFLNTTTNGEFAFATSLWPDVSRKNVDTGAKTGSFPQSSSKYMMYGIGRMFANEGASTFGFHNYLGSYYDRENSWANLGISTLRFMDGKNPMKFSSNWITSDLEMMQQAVDDFINEDRFLVYSMTFSGHGRYSTSKNSNAKKNHAEAAKINKECGYNYSEEALCYMAANMELDKALEYLINRLEEAGKLDKTVIVLAADHYPYFISSVEVATELNGGVKVDNNIGRYKSTCFIYNSAVKEPIINENYCSNIDILPTIFNLFNMPYDSRLLIGKDVFAPNVVHKSVLYNKSFINEAVEYHAPKAKANWKMDTSQLSKSQLNDYVSSMLDIINKEYSVALKMMDTDFYKFVKDHMGSN